MIMEYIDCVICRNKIDVEECEFCGGIGITALSFETNLLKIDKSNSHEDLWIFKPKKFPGKFYTLTASNEYMISLYET